MSILPSQSLPAPVGMDANSDPLLAPVNKAQFVQNALADRQGILRTNVGLPSIPMTPALPAPVDGLAPYYGATTAGDKVLVACTGNLWAYSPIRDANGKLTGLTNGASAGYGLTPGRKIRYASYKNETLIVQDGGLQPLRYDGTGLYLLGILPPAAPTVTAFGVGNKNGTLTYKVTYYDSRLRESSPSPGTTVTFTGQQAEVQINYGTDPQVAGAYVYVNTSGGTVFYRVATLAKPATLYTDNTGDTAVSNTSLLAPGNGQYDIPNPASAIAVHKNHIFLNDLTVPGQMQINNLGSPTQWASIVYQPSDGVKLSVDTDQADPIIALAPFGSLLGIWKRRGFYQLWGDDETDFLIRPLHEKGCIAPDTALRCDNVLLYLADDGVYSANYQDGFLLHEVSEDIRPFLQAMPYSTLEAAFAIYADRKYFLVIGPTIYVLDLTNNGWTSLNYG